MYVNALQYSAFVIMKLLLYTVPLVQDAILNPSHPYIGGTTALPNNVKKVGNWQMVESLDFTSFIIIVVIVIIIVSFVSPIHVEPH